MPNVYKTQYGISKDGDILKIGDSSLLVDKDGDITIKEKGISGVRGTGGTIDI